MTLNKWEEFKKDAEALDNKPCKNLGICEISFGCLKGKPYLEIIPIVTRIKDGEVPGLILEFNETNNALQNMAIMELAKNAEKIDDIENTIKILEELKQKRKANSNAIKDLEI